MGLLTLLKFPSVLTPVGSITRIVNAKGAGSQGMNWSYQNQGGVVSNARTYTNTIRVQTNSPFVGPIQIQQALIGFGCVQGSSYRFPLPEYNGDAGTPASPTEQDTGSFLHGIDIKQDADDARSWICTFEYGPYDIGHESGQTNVTQGSTNPLEMFPDVKWTPATFEASYPQDINGKPWLNTAGDPLEDPPKRSETRQALSFTRNEATYNDSYAQQFRETVNESAFLGFGPNKVKCKSILGVRQYLADYGVFWSVTYEFEFRIINFVVPTSYDPVTGLDNDSGSMDTYGWEDLVPNLGFQSLDVSGKKQQIIISGQPIPHAVWLDQDGTYDPATVQNANLPPPYYLVFMQYESKDFSLLNIPDDVLTQNQ